MIDYFWYLVIFAGCAMVGFGAVDVGYILWDHFTNPKINLQMAERDFMRDVERASPWGEEK